MYRTMPTPPSLSVGDVRVRASDGVLVEIIHVDTDAGIVRAMPYALMAGQGRHSTAHTFLTHPDRKVDCVASDFRDVTDTDITNPAETKAMNT